MRAAGSADQTTGSFLHAAAPPEPADWFDLSDCCSTVLDLATRRRDDTAEPRVPRTREPWEKTAGGMLPDFIHPSNYLHADAGRHRQADEPVHRHRGVDGAGAGTSAARQPRQVRGADRSRPRTTPTAPSAASGLLETPPEKARLVHGPDGWQTLKMPGVERCSTRSAEFRRVPNLFEIVSWDYWQKNFGHALTEPLAARKRAYVAGEAGRRHVLDIIETPHAAFRRRAGGARGDAGGGQARPPPTPSSAAGTS